VRPDGPGEPHSKKMKNHARRSPEGGSCRKKRGKVRGKDVARTFGGGPGRVRKHLRSFGEKKSQSKGTQTNVHMSKGGHGRKKKGTKPAAEKARGTWKGGSLNEQSR